MSTLEIKAAVRNLQHILQTVPMTAEPHGLIIHAIKVLEAYYASTIR